MSEPVTKAGQAMATETWASPERIAAIETEAVKPWRAALCEWAEAYHSANEIENPAHRGTQVFDRLHPDIPQCDDYRCEKARALLADAEAER